MNDDQLLRYSRHILLDELGIEGQKRLIEAHALVVGAGGLGSPVVLYLAAAGVGRITVCDGDRVDLTNLQRQIAHDTAAIGQNKAESAAASARRINPEVMVEAVPRRVAAGDLERLVAAADVVVDASDNFATRHAVNRACVAAAKPLVSGAAVRFDGQVAVFDARRESSPCYHCLFPEGGQPDEMRCAENGVFAPLVGIIGTVQAAEALKLLADLGTPLSGRLLLLNALDMSWRTIRVPRDPACSVCSRTLSPPVTRSAATRP
ncbi:HesA/MoeB/ThiF family protein [Thiobacter aerophilum]|uniref:Molybdopterin-synthase adenylyltransferase MoeB n=1 Tax=Thiobacter aerophilum TaxID=3121275 RepID=A0ABV0EGU0_9BURK